MLKNCSSYFLFLLILIALSGCGTWKKVKDVYKGYALPAEVELDNEVDLDEKECCLAENFTQVDQKLEMFLQDLEAMENLKGQREIKSLLSRHSWLKGMATLDKEMKVIFQQPDIEVEFDHWQKEFKKEVRVIRFVPSNMDQQGLCLLFKPVYNSNELQGFITAYFDFIDLVKYAKNPMHLIVLQPKRVLWEGKYGANAYELLKKDWEELLKDGVCGEINLEKRNFFWISRFVNNDPLVYLTHYRE